MGIGEMSRKEKLKDQLVKVIRKTDSTITLFVKDSSIINLNFETNFIIRKDGSRAVDIITDSITKSITFTDWRHADEFLRLSGELIANHIEKINFDEIK